MRDGGKRVFGVLLCCVVLCSFVTSSSAAIYDPAKKWHTIKTKHFKIHYPEHIEDVAMRAADIFEDVHATLSPELSWKPRSRTEVVLTDDTDEANGFATVLPYNKIILFVAAPRGDSILANYDDWLRLLITHEYTHILHLDKVGGPWWVFRLLLGKTVSPAGVVPVWIKEGFATYEETKHSAPGRGRGNSTTTEMMLRTLVAENDFPKIDEADGLQWRWPSYLAAYIYGVSFIQYLVETYGEEKFLKFNQHVQGSLLLTMINHQANRIYGKSFYILWNEWHEVLKKKYQPKIQALGELTPLEPLIKEREPDAQYSSPAYAPTGTEVAYTLRSPHHSSKIRVYDVAKGVDRLLMNVAGATRAAWRPKSDGLVVSVLGRYKRYHSFYDLINLDLHTMKKSVLTEGERAKDPAVHPDGTKILYVAGSGGKDVLKIFDRETKEIIALTSENEVVQYYRPTWSPDGEFIATSLHSEAHGWKLYLLSADGKRQRRLTRGKGTELDPAWAPDGKSIFFASDETGISNIYRVWLDRGKVERITNTATGLFQPTTRDGDWIVAQHYHAGGYDLVRFRVPQKPYAVTERVRAPFVKTHEIKNEAVSSEQTPAPKKYSAFGTSLLIPRYISPNAFFTGDTTIFTAMTGATDALRWHTWSGGVSYRLDAAHLGYFGSYSYARYRPILSAGFQDAVVNFGNLLFLGTGRVVHYYEERRGGYGALTLPINRHAFSLSFAYQDHFPKSFLDPVLEEPGLNTGIFAGPRLVYAYGEAEGYPASISIEEGRRVRLFTSTTDSTFGSGERNEQVIFAGDWREYIGLPHHHVIALRGAGGMTWRDTLVQGTFSMGGALGEGTLAGGGSLFYFPLRGLPVSTLSRTRAMLFSAEYRIPLLAPQRGLGTTPFFIKHIHAAVFADYGNAWNAHEAGSDRFADFFDQFMLGVGGELRSDLVVGHGLPLVGRLGYGILVVNRDRFAARSDDVLGTAVKHGTLILQLGTSF